METICKPTYYNGYHFRSRLEARWAVFFDAMEIKYHYEYQDFILPDGTRYLPDFYLPGYAAMTDNCYCEVKAQFTESEIQKCKQLYLLTGVEIVLLEGVPDFRTVNIIGDGEPFNEVCIFTGVFHNGRYGYRFYVCPEFENENGWFNPEDWDHNYTDAVIKSRSARFEFEVGNLRNVIK